MKMQGPNSTSMVPQDFVRFCAQFQIKPAELAVVAADNEMITRGMYIHGGDPLDPRHQGFEQLLLCEVVKADVMLGCDKEEGLGRVEEN